MYNCYCYFTDAVFFKMMYHFYSMIKNRFCTFDPESKLIPQSTPSSTVIPKFTS